jgi:DNA-binding NarL/FixJ family response regulator
MGELVHVTARIEIETRDALKAMARSEMMKTGEVVTLADMIRDALDRYTSLARLIVRSEPATEQNLDLFDQGKPARRKADDPETLALKAQAAELVAEGMTQREVAAALKISQSKVSKLLRVNP